ncbi:MAG TPA: helix-turn-helix domain-containing protein [Gemmatimonadales bacterium]|jgi:hypothetical protein
MSQPDLPDDVRRLIQTSIPTLEALEIVLLLARDPGREWHAQAIPQLLVPTPVSEAAVSQYLAVLAEQGIVSVRDDQRFVYEPRTPEITRAIEGLIVAYHQRPVTLIRTVYASAEMRTIQSFASAFRLRRDV